MKQTLLVAVLTLLITACGAQGNETNPGMGMNNDGMMTRHHAEIPAEYAGLKNPIPADEESLERGATLYTTNCSSCHGDGGMGDGPAGAALVPAPAAVARTVYVAAVVTSKDQNPVADEVTFPTAVPFWVNVTAAPAMRAVLSWDAS